MDTYDTTNDILNITNVAYGESNKLVQIAAYKKIRKNRGVRIMSEQFKRFIGQDCLVYVLGSTPIDATVKEVGDTWIIITDTTGADSVINIEFITRIREYPKNKNGKRKLVFD